MIRKCKAKDFIPNLQEINNYFQVRKQIDKITHTKQLLNIIKIYFETILFFKANSVTKNKVNIKGKLYHTEINGHDKKGNPIKLGINEISESIVKDVAQDLKKTLNTNSFEDYVIIINSVLETPNIDSNHKISILNAENLVFVNEWTYLLFILSEQLAKETIQLRKSLILKILTAPEKHLTKDQFFDKNIETLYKAYEFYVKAAIRLFISKNHFVEVLRFLYHELQEFDEIPPEIELDENRLIFFLLNQIILNNNLFFIEEKSKIKELYESFEEFLSNESKKILKEGIEFSPKNFEIQNASIELAKPDFSNTDLDKIVTLISFTIPQKAINNFVKIEYDDKTTIEFSLINNLFDDPIFRFLDSSELTLNSLPFSVFSDSIGFVNNSVLVTIIIKDFFHPDFEIENINLKYKDFSEHEAKIGRKYYPHKDYIIDILRRIKQNESFNLPITIDLDEINVNLISNYYLGYFDQNHKRIFHKVYTITNLDTYLKLKNRYLTSLNSLNLDDDYNNIRKLAIETEINSANDLQNYLVSLINITAKKSIEQRGIANNLWIESARRKTPISEPNAQPLIYNLLNLVAEIKGIQISREIVAANGSLDYHCSYTKDDRLYKVCIELKNAHNQNIEHGITNQLPAYIRDKGSRYGIYLVLWYKSENYANPSKYDTIKALENSLNKLSPKGFKIKTIIIDCTFKNGPSKLK
ncbi:hypothetical protein ES705_11401 [subsurface metagenome]